MARHAISTRAIEDLAATPLDARASAVAGFQIVLARLAVDVAGHVSGAVDGSDVEELHDLRVAIRRTRAVLGEAKSVVAPEVSADARRGFSRLGRLTGPVRDLDVHLAAWPDDVAPLGVGAAAALRPAVELLQRRRSAAHTLMAGKLSSARTSSMLGAWHEQIVADWSAGAGRHGDRPLGDVLRHRLERAHRHVVDDGRLIDASSPADQLHDLRKRAKVLRYLVECFGELVDERPLRRYVKRLRRLQNTLGAHQDAEVHVELVQGLAVELHAEGAGADTLLALGRLVERLEQRRLTARAEFDERFAAFDSSDTERAFEAVLACLDIDP